MTAVADFAPPLAVPLVPSTAPAPADLVTYAPAALPDIAVGQELAVEVPQGWTEQQYLRAVALHEQERAQLAVERAHRAAVAEWAGVVGSLALAALLGWLAWTRFDGFDTLILVGKVVFWTGAGAFALTMGGAARARLATLGGRKMAIRTGPHPHHKMGDHGTWTASEHEAGHVVVARGVGCTVLSAHVFRDGSGVTFIRFRRDIDPISSIAVDVAGHVGARTSSGCGSDFSFMYETLRGLEPGERGRTKSRAYDKARSIINSPFSDHPGVSKQIFEKGSVYF